MKERSKETISYVMSRIKGKNTGIEIALRKELYRMGVRYRNNTSYVYGHLSKNTRWRFFAIASFGMATTLMKTKQKSIKT